MKLIGSGLFIIIGVFIAIIVTRGFGEKSAGYVVNIVLGVFGAFFGLWLKDIFNIQLLGNLSGAAVFSALGAMIILVPANIMWLSTEKR